MAAAGVPEVSVVFPVWNEEGNLETLYEQVREACQKAGASYEMLFVDNGSNDRSLEIIKRLRDTDPCVRFVSLSRNFGYQGGILAGLSYTRGEAVITMDADLQHPPSLIPEMIALWRQGYEVVYTIKRSAQLSGLKLQQMRLFYWLMSKLSGLKLSFGQSDFRLLDRKVADVIVAIPEYRKFLRGLVDWVGFRQVGLAYDVAPRRAGRSKFGYRELVSFAWDGILAFSIVPLRILFATGVIVASVSLAYVAFVVALGVMRLFGSKVDLPAGWVTLVASGMFLGSIQLIGIGLLGEYLGRLYDQTKGRPVFIVREAAGTERTTGESSTG